MESLLHYLAIEIGIEVQKNCGDKLSEFKFTIAQPEHDIKVAALKKQVQEFALGFPLPGLEVL